MVPGICATTIQNKERSAERELVEYLERVCCDLSDDRRLLIVDLRLVGRRRALSGDERSDGEDRARKCGRCGLGGNAEAGAGGHVGD